LTTIVSLSTWGHWIEVDLGNRPKNRVVVRCDGRVVVSESKWLFPGRYTFHVDEGSEQVEYILELKVRPYHIPITLTRDGTPVLVIP